MHWRTETRSLRGGSSLAQLLIKARGPEARCTPSRRGPLTIPVILAWAEARMRGPGDCRASIRDRFRRESLTRGVE